MPVRIDRLAKRARCRWVHQARTSGLGFLPEVGEDCGHDRSGRRPFQRRGLHCPKPGRPGPSAPRAPACRSRTLAKARARPPAGLPYSKASSSMPSSCSLRVMVLRPMPRRWAASNPAAVGDGQGRADQLRLEAAGQLVPDFTMPLGVGVLQQLARLLPQQMDPVQVGSGQGGVMRRGQRGHGHGQSAKALFRQRCRRMRQRGRCRHAAVAPAHGRGGFAQHLGGQGP